MGSVTQADGQNGEKLRQCTGLDHVKQMEEAKAAYIKRHCQNGDVFPQPVLPDRNNWVSQPRHHQPVAAELRAAISEDGCVPGGAMGCAGIRHPKHQAM